MRGVLKSPSFIMPTFFIAFLYLAVTLYLLNARLISSTLRGTFSLDYKIQVLFLLLGGLWTSMPILTAVGLIIAAVLTGANLVLMARNLTSLKSQKGLHVVVGGSSILGIVGSGCAACELPLLSVFGISGGLSILPFKGGEFIYISVLLLLVSFYFLVRNLNDSQICSVEFLKRKR